MSLLRKIIIGTVGTSFMYAADAGMAPLGAGFVVIGAGVGIGKIFSPAAEATARQPEAADEIRSTVNLPLFLLEGVAIIALVVCILAVVL